MLNDLLTVADALTAHGIGFTPRHPGIKDMNKEGALGVLLGPDGEIADLLPLSGGRGELWTLRDGQQNGFPGLQTDGPLLAIPAEEVKAHKERWKAAKNDTAAKRKELDHLIAAFPFAPAPDWPRAGHRARIAERLKLLRVLADDSHTAALPAVHERFLLALERESALLEGLYSFLKDPGLSEDLHEWAAKALTEKVSLLIDVTAKEGLRPVRDARQIAPLSQALAAAAIADEEAETGTSGVCALTGVTANLHRGNFPQPNLPGLGQTYLFARNKDIPAMARYGRLAAGSFPLAAGVPERLAGALGSLTAPSAEGKTWLLIPAESGKTPDLLLAVLPAAPDAGLAGALGGDEDALAAAHFEQMTGTVLKHATGRSNEEFPAEQVTLLALRQLDPANRKTIYHRQLSASAFHEAATNWQDAIANLPNGITLPVPDGKQLKDAKPPFLPPLSLTSVSRRSYTRGKPAGADVVGVPLTTAYQVFLREGGYQTSARRALQALLARYTPLLIGVTDARARGALRDIDRTGVLRKDALKAVTWFGVLLWMVERKKEDYVRESAFLLGQLLAAVDDVHIGYCIDVREGAIPPTLLGNSLLTTAAADHKKALAMLLKRWPPYAAWAKHEGSIFQKAGNLRPNDAYALKRAVYRSRDLKETALALREQLEKYPGTKEDFHAELLLGYMAGIPRQPKGGNDAASTVEEEEEA